MAKNKKKYQNGGKVAKTKQEQYIGLNNPNYNQIFFPMKGENIFRGLDNYQPVQLIDEEGNAKTLVGPNDTTIMKGNVMEKKAKSGIHIKKSHRGRFTAWAKKQGMSVQEAASHVMANKDKYPSSVVKMANFAKNFAEDGLDLQPLKSIDPNFQGISLPGQITPYIDTNRQVPLPNSYTKGSPFNPEVIPFALSVADRLMPYQEYNNIQHIPQEYNEHPYGTGSQAIYQTGGEITPKKQLSDQDVYNSYYVQLGGDHNPDADRMASILTISKKFNVPTTSIYSSTERKPNGVPLRRQFTVLGPDGKLFKTFTQGLEGLFDYGTSVDDGHTAEPMPIEKSIASKKSGGKVAKSGMNFKSKGDYKKWLGYIHANHLAENTPGNTPVSIKGKHHNVDHSANYGADIPIDIYGGGSAKVLSTNPFSSSPTIEFTGNSHEEGGIDIGFGNAKAEVEGNETALLDNGGDLNIMGNLKVPGTKKKFKTAMKNLSSKENDINKVLNKAHDIYNKYSSDVSSFGELGTNSAKLMEYGSRLKQKKLASAKQGLIDMQNIMLDTANKLSVKPEKLYAKNGGKMQSGGRLTPEELNNYLRMFGAVESSDNYSAKSKKGTAYGRYQFTKDTRDNIFKQNTGAFKAAGIDSLDEFENKFKESPELQDQVMTIHLNNLYNKYNGNPQYIALAHRIGESSADSLINKGYYILNGEKKGWDDPITASLTGKESPSDYIRKVTGSVPNIPIVSTETPPEPALPNLTFNYNNPIPKPVPIDVPTNTPARTPTGNYTSPYIPTPKSPYEPTPLNISQILPELATIGLNAERGVQGQSFTPRLYQPFQVSFQDQLNENNAAFRGYESLSPNNPEFLSSLSAKRYQANTGILGNEFRTNQQIENDVVNKNIGLLNSANQANLQLGDQQYVRQEQAHANTVNRDLAALESISSKVNQNILENKREAVLENLYPYYRLEDVNNDGIAEAFNFVGPKKAFKSGGKVKSKKYTNGSIVKALK